MSLNPSADQVAISAPWQLGGAALRPRVHRETAKRRSKGMRRLIRIGWNLLPPLTFVAMVALWWAVIRGSFKIPAYLLPGPGAVFSRLVDRCSAAVERTLRS